MSLGGILSESWKDYKNNFKPIFKAFLLFLIIPSFILVLASTYLNVSQGVIQDVLSGKYAADPFYTFKLYLQPAFASLLLLQLIVFFVFLIVMYGLYVSSLKSKKFSYTEIIRSGKQNYWRLLGFSIVFILMMIGFTLLLFIPVIIFGVFFSLAILIYIEKKAGIKNSLKQSYRLVRGRWWRTFGYFVVFMLVLLGIDIVFSIPAVISGVIWAFKFISGGEFDYTLFYITTLIDFIAQQAYNLIATPLGIFFLKNLYLDYKRSR